MATRANWQLALVCGNRRVDLITSSSSAGWTLAEGGAGFNPSRITATFGGGSPWKAGSTRTGSTMDNVQYTLGLRLLNMSNKGQLLKNIHDVYQFCTETLRYYEMGQREPVYLVRRLDEGYSGTGQNIVLFGRNDLYHEVLSIDQLTFPSETYGFQLGEASQLQETQLVLTCKPYAVGDPTFLAEATGWVRTDTDGNIEVWAGATNLIHNPGFEHATFSTDWSSSDGTLTAAVEYQRVHSGFQAARLTNVDTALGRTYTVTLTLASQVYAISCYVYTDGTAVSTTDCSLVGQNAQLTTTYTADADNPGWYWLTALFSGIAASSLHGIREEAGKVVCVDDFQLEIFTATNITSSGVLLSNTGFETAGGGGADIFGSWTEAADDGTITDSGTAQAGTHAAQLTGGPATQLTSVSQAGAVTAGTAYILWYYARGDATNAGRFRIYDVTNAANIIATSSTGITAASYALCSAYFVAPAGCTSVSIWFYCPAVNGGNAWFDTVVLMAWPTGIAAHSPFMLKDGYTVGPGIAWASTVHDSNQTRTAGQYRVRSYWTGQPGYEAMFAGKGAISIWVKTAWAAQDNQSHYIFDSYVTTTTNRWSIYKAASNYLYFQLFGSTSGGYKLLGTTINNTQWAANIWHHIYVSWDDGEPVGFYLDGALYDNTVSTVGTWTDPNAVGPYFYLGSTGAGALQSNTWIGDVRIFGPDATVTPATLYGTAATLARGKSELPFLWTSAIGGTLQSTRDTTNTNEFWIANLPGNMEIPLRLLLHNDGGSWDHLWLALHKNAVFPYKLNIVETVGYYYPSAAGPTTQADATRSGGSYERLSISTVTSWVTAHAVCTDARWGQYVTGRYRVLAIARDAAATGVCDATMSFANNTAASGATVLTDHQAAPWTDSEYPDKQSYWTVLDLGVLDVVLASLPDAFPGQIRMGISTVTNHISLMLDVDSSGGGVNFDVDYFVLMPAAWMLKSGAMASNDLLIVDGLSDGIAWTSNEGASSAQMMEVSSWASYDGAAPSVAPLCWTFGNVLTTRSGATSDQTPADAVRLFAIYQPRYLWGR